jgi:hypothetical protein
MTPTQRKYFDDMNPGDTLHVSQVSNPNALIQAGKEYIDLGGCLTFSDDYSKVTKHLSVEQIEAMFANRTTGIKNINSNNI